MESVDRAGDGDARGAGKVSGPSGSTSPERRAPEEPPSSVWVTGAGGLLGSEVAEEARRRGMSVRPLAREDLDVTDAEAVSRVFVRERAPAPTARSGAEAPGAPARPGVVVHCAAFTNVDAAEAEPVRAARVNHQGTAHVAEAAARLGMRFVYVSTDYVFDGEARTPYRPDAAPGPRSVYGRTKLAGERAALSSSRSALVVRTSWLYGRGGRNFVTAMLERGRTGASARVVEDQRGRPTWARNAACGILDLAARRAKGIWHCADSGEATWLELAREIYRLEGIEAPLFPTSTEEWGAPAPRPPYSVLDLRATEALLGRRMPDWREALRAFLETQGAVGAR